MNLTAGKARVALHGDQVSALRAAGTLIEDPRRERPRYFDGRFLAARDLIRDQTYFLTREADLGQAAGSGVATGLEVARDGGGGERIIIAPGHGVTPAGELVLLPREVRLELADVAQAEQLSARFGLGRIPHPPLRNRTGLFVLALRPVEFSTGRVGAYPTSLTGQRSHEDADIAEATAIVLVPWRDDGAQDALDERRAGAAAAIFVRDGGTALSGDVLPIAMIAVQNNVVAWIDVAMVRRELGADRSDLPGLGYSPRALRLAHLMQYQQHLADLVQSNGGRGFPARESFPALPSVGPMPPGMIDPVDFSQNFFPAEMDVEFSIVPEDELTALVEEALALPPLDLEAGPETLESTAVLVLAPVPRNAWRAVAARLATPTRRLRPAAANLVATRKPLEILRKLRVPAISAIPASPDPAQAEWARLAAQGNLWFIRRRNLAYRDELAGEAIAIAGIDDSDSEEVNERLSTLGLTRSLTTVESRSTPQAVVETRALLASPRFAASPTLTAAAIGELSKAETVDHATVLRVTSELTAPGVGDGLTRLENATPETLPSRVALAEIAAGADWRTADKAAASARRSELGGLAREVLRPQKITDSRSGAGNRVESGSASATRDGGARAGAPEPSARATAKPRSKAKSPRRKRSTRKTDAGGPDKGDDS